MMCGADAETQQLHGRTQAHAPEVDGVVYITGADAYGYSKPSAGTLADVKITQALEYDLIGEMTHV
jgi:tRNA A37 methylthiotransferase MiaB